MVALPVATPVTTPVVLSIDAVELLLLLQVPPVVLWLRVVVRPVHTPVLPVIAAGALVIVIANVV